MKKSIRLFAAVMVCMAMALCVSCKKDNAEPSGGGTGGGNTGGGGGNAGGGISGCFSVSPTTTVEFAPGNLYWDGSAFRFEADQWSFANTWNASYVSHFYWSKTASVAYAQDYSDESASTSDVFFTNSSSFQVDGETAGTWRTLSKDEWGYLLNSRTDATNLSAWKELDSGAHKGLVILPDGTENPSTVMGGITSTADLASSGAVFLPAAGSRDGTDVDDAGSYGGYWSGTPYEDFEGCAYHMYFLSGYVLVHYGYRYHGYSVRLVRSAS